LQQHPLTGSGITRRASQGSRIAGFQSAMAATGSGVTRTAGQGSRRDRCHIPDHLWWCGP